VTNSREVTSTTPPMTKSFMLLWELCKLGNTIFFQRSLWHIVTMSHSNF